MRTKACLFVGAASVSLTAACGPRTGAGPTSDGESTSGSTTFAPPDSDSMTTRMLPDVGVDDGCGDGVPEPGVYCFVEYEMPEMIRAGDFVVADFDDDGGAELALNLYGVSPSETVFARWNDGLEILARGEPIHPPFLARTRIGGPLELVGTQLPYNVDDVFDRVWLEDGVVRHARDPVTHDFDDVVDIWDASGVIDLGRDGRHELFCGASTGGTTWYVHPYALVDGEWTAAGEELAMPLFTQHKAVSGDLDGDGFAELIVPEEREGGSRLHVFRAGARGVETVWTTDKDLDFGVMRLSLGDLDGDGWLDLVAGGLGDFVLARGRGDGTFEVPQSLHVPEYAFPDEDNELGPFREVTAGDLDGDGRSELIASFVTPGGAYFDGRFDLVVLEEPFSDPSVTAILSDRPLGFGMTTGDLDGDGVDDLFLQRVTDDDQHYLLMLLSDP